MTCLETYHIITPADGLQMRTDVHGEVIPEPAVLSLLDLSACQVDGYTAFESICIRAIEGAMAKTAPFDLSHTGLILSSTKGEIWTPLPDSAKHISAYFGLVSQPIVVSTACTSGVVAQITAARLLESGYLDRAIVVGADLLSNFIISGFRSFKALADEPCRPFDDSLPGLNLGEAAAAMILRRGDDGWTMLGGSIHNDANHISGPSRTAEGSYRCLIDMLQLTSKDELEAISVHGTGTLYNDTMERLAIERAGLTDIPMHYFKGIYGHTLGAAGLLETILTMEKMQNEHTSFIKLLSGFGGVNAAVTWRR